MSKPFIPRGRFQTEATQFLLRNPRANLHVDMGLGKTIMVLNAIDSLIIAGELNPVLVVAPLRVATNTWGDEIAKWDHLSYLRVSPIVGDKEKRGDALRKEADIYTINFENLPWLVDELKDSWPFRTIVIDESTRLKSHRSHFRAKKGGTATLVCTSGVRSSAIARLSFTKTLRFWNLTGTPAANGLYDLWGQQFFIDKGEALGRSFSAFEQRWFRKDFKGYSLELLPGAEARIRAAIAPTTFTLRAEDYLVMGEEITNDIFVTMPERARKLYDEMEKNLYIEIKAGEVEAFTAATKSTKIHQIANGAIYYDKQGSWELIHDAKIDALQSVIEEAGGMPVIVVYQFKSDLVRLRKAFPKGRAFDTKPETERDFKAGKIPVLFLHPASGGHGSDGFQHVTNQICFFSLDWNGENRIQSIARIGKVRQLQAGFDRPVFIHQIICRDTIDEDILERIKSKKTIADALKDGLARRNLK